MKPVHCALLVSWSALSVACHSRAENDAAAPRASASVMPAPSGAPDVSSPERTQKAVAALDAIAKIHREAPDCDTMAMQLTQYAGQYGRPDTSPAVMRAVDLDEALAARVRHAMESIMTASMKCRGNPAFEALHARVRSAPAR
jgi:hypothetical protein